MISFHIHAENLAHETMLLFLIIRAASGVNEVPQQGQNMLHITR